MRIYSKYGFTLSEVLIALTVIGVIAALTVPALIQNTQKQEYVSRLKKVYSTMSQAANMIIAEHGSPKASDGGWASSNANMCALFEKYTNNTGKCTTANVLRFSDGASVSFYSGSNSDFLTCTHCSGDPCTRNTCADISVDVNGYAKPNKKGRDIFYFVLQENGFHPMSCSDSGCKTSGGWGCACKVLREGAMNY